MKSIFDKNGFYVHIALIMLLGIVSYSNSLAVPEQFDDQAILRSYNHVGTNLFTVQSFIGKARWFTDITFSLNRRLHGEHVLGFHLVNLAVHLSAAVIIYLMLRRIIEALNKTFRLSEDDSFLELFIPFTTAALFVCHPVQTQAVTYITQRYTSLTTLLYVGSLLSYLLTRLSFTDDTKKLRKWAWGGACLLLALLAMKSKEIAFTLPLMIVVFEIMLFRGELLKNRIFWALVIGLLLVIPLQLIYAHGAKSSGNLLHQVYRATSETPGISRIDYLLTQFGVVATYLRLLFFPINQNLDYDYPVYHSFFNQDVIISLLLHIVLLACGVALFIRSKRQFTSGAAAAAVIMRLASLGIFWFYLALSVESSLFPIRDVIYEHRIYLPSIGFFIVAAAGFACIASYLQRYRTAIWVAIMMLCVAFTTGTIARNRVWASEMVMWQDVSAKSPHKARARYNLGFQYYKKYKLEQALPHLVRSLELETGMDEYWNTLGAVIFLLNRYQDRCSTGDEYCTTVDSVVTVDPKFRNHWSAERYNNLGLAYEHLGNLYLARENFLKAATANPSLDHAWFNLALVSSRQDDAPGVASSLARLRAINPLLEHHAAQLFRDQGYPVR